MPDDVDVVVIELLLLVVVVVVVVVIVIAVGVTIGAGTYGFSVVLVREAIGRKGDAAAAVANDVAAGEGRGGGGV